MTLDTDDGNKYAIQLAKNLPTVVNGDDRHPLDSFLVDVELVTRSSVVETLIKSCLDSAKTNLSPDVAVKFKHMAEKTAISLLVEVESYLPYGKRIDDFNAIIPHLGVSSGIMTG